jgi:hypothetical protein
MPSGTSPSGGLASVQRARCNICFAWGILSYTTRNLDITTRKVSIARIHTVRGFAGDLR